MPMNLSKKWTLTPLSSGRQRLIDPRQALGQALDPIDDEVADLAIHPLDVPTGLPIHRDAERMHAHGLCLPQRRLGVLQGVLLLVGVVQRAAIAQHHEELDLGGPLRQPPQDRKSTRLNSSHGYISYAVFCLKKKKHKKDHTLYLLSN